MNHVVIDPFESIESAHEFVSLLAKTALQSRREIESDVQREAASDLSRRLDALRLTFYNLEKLELHLNKTRRILNDLRSLRRLLFEERKNGTTPRRAESIAAANTDAPSATAQRDLVRTATVPISVALLSRAGAKPETVSSV